MNFKRFENWIFSFLLFTLPWQLRHTFFFADIGGNYFEYGSYHIYLSEILLILLILVWLFRLKLDFRKVTVGPKIIFWPLFALALLSLASTFWSVVPLITIYNVAKLGLLFALYLYIINEVTSFTQITRPILWGLLFQGAIAIGQYLNNHSLGLKIFGESILDPVERSIPVIELNGMRQLRAAGTLPHANLLGGYIVVALWLTIYEYYKANDKKVKNFLLLILTVGFIALLYSYARSAWLALAVSGIIFSGLMAVSRKPKDPNRSRVNFLYPILAGLILMTAIWAERDLILSRFNLNNRLEQISVTERVEGLEDFQEIFGQNPIFGQGFGAYPSSLAKTFPESGIRRYEPVHNFYLVVVGELGIIGFFFLILLLGLILREQLRNLIRQIKDKAISLVSIFSITIFISVLVLGLFDHYLWTLQQGRFLLFLMLAIISLGLSLQKRSA